MAFDPNITKSIERGIPVLAIAACTAVNNNFSQPLSLIESPNAPAPALYYEVTFPNGALTAFSFQPQISVDGGATWQNRGAVIDGVANPAGALPTIEGCKMRLVPTALTLGTAPSVSVLVNT